MIKFPTKINSPTGPKLDTIIKRKRKESVQDRHMRIGFRSPDVIAMNAKLA